MTLFEVCFVSLNKNFVFGKKIAFPSRANNRKASDVANAGVLLIIRETKNVSVNVPKFAPRIKGIAFFKLIKRATANGTNNPMVMLEENTIPVNTAPVK